MRVNVPEAIQGVTTCMFTKLVANIVGSPGIGKSAIIHQLAEKYKLKVIDVRLSQCDPTDMLGFPKLNGRRSTFVPPDLFPLDDDEVPEGYEGFMIFLDEMNAAPLAVQAAAYRLALDRQVGSRNLHPRAVIVCAGNLMTDGAITNRLSTAMQSRLVHFEMRVDHKAWSQWASANNLATEVISYINHKPDALHQFDPKHNDKTFPAPRTWEFASRIMKYNPSMKLQDKLPTLAGTVGEGAAQEFVMYCDVYKHIPSYQDIKKDPKGIEISGEPAMQAALAGIVGSNLSVHDLKPMMEYILRLPFQFQVFTLRDAIKRTPLIAKEKELGNWLTQYGEQLFV